ncbi:MAG: gephyrin-like molybdotransferase receptor GlpR [Mycobacterium sp.]
MPSIPQSLLWISLVVLWLFVLVPMLINRRDTVRRTSDVALATRVLNTGSRAARLIKRGKPAAGHRSDPDWQPTAESDEDEEEFDEEKTGPVVVTGRPSRVRSVAVVTGLAEEAEPDYLDVDVVDDDSGALPVGRVVKSAEPEAEPAPVVAEEPQLDFGDAAEQTEELEPEAAVDESDDADETDDGTDDEYEYIEDTSGLEAEDEPATAKAPRSAASRPRSFESKTAAAVTARKYQFRKRVLLTMAALLVFTTAAAFLLTPSAWYVTGAVGAVTLLYLAYLRRQTRIEERLRRRRMQRMARSRLGVENTHDTDLDVTPARLRQPGAAVLEIDDEDPIFEHLDEVAFAREYSLPHAAGQ